MTIIQAIILGIIQGLTEFFPVSSSGHLLLAQTLLGYQNLDSFILFDLVCHLGTLLAIFVIFKKEIIDALCSRLTFFQIVLGTLPLIPLVALLKPIKSLFNQPANLGFLFLLTSALLLAGIHLGKAKSESLLYRKRWLHPLLIGLFQALAILPGVSRSGATISGARLLGWSPDAAIKFSFLMAIPAILGATCLELLQLAKGASPANELNWAHYAAGFLTSLLMGYISLKILIKLVPSRQFNLFAYYCMALGLFILLTL